MPKTMPPLTWLSQVSLLDDQPSVLNAGHSLDVNEAGVGIHCHLGELDPAGAAGRQPLLPLARYHQRVERELFARLRPIGAARVGHSALLLEFGEGFGADVIDGGGDRCRGGAAAAAAGVGNWVSPMRTSDLLRLETKNLRCHNGDDGANAGAQVLRAARDFDAAVRVYLGLGLGAVAAAAPTGSGAADPGFHGAGRTAGRLVFRLPPEALRAELQCLPPNLERIILKPQLDRVQLQLDGQLVHDRLHAERCRGMPGRPQRAGRPGIDGHPGLLHAHVRHVYKYRARGTRSRPPPPSVVPPLPMPAVP